MCTAITYKTKNFYFGRTLDYDFSYEEQITVTPRNFSLPFRHLPEMKQHYAIIGMAYTVEGYPLYYDAVNEKGLAMAGLNFVGNAHYNSTTEGMDNVASFEFIPWLLSKCESVCDARILLSKTNLVNTAFNEQLPPASLHWLLADKSEAITIESTKTGLHIYDNPIGVLTNNPPFPQQLFHLNNYMQLSPSDPKNRFSSKINLQHYSRGMGAIGLPGDLSSQSRFVRAAFTKLNSVSGNMEEESVNQFFHILSTVSQTKGCCHLEGNRYEITIYSSCCNANKGIYYYTTYGSHRICAVNMHKSDLDSNQLTQFPLIKNEQILFQN
ncbi:MAG: choloylglycine hydrolase [Oscillospiraceae bacterium]|nr:choloylglycine hydrolase [Oscillospiraceae bacterium]